MTERTFFGTDGVRSVAGEFPLTPQWVVSLGGAAAEVLKRAWQGVGRPSVVIGKDTRRSGDMLAAALAAGLSARGVDVVQLGVLPTPGVSYLTRQLGALAGAVISASHNPYEDNGIKFFAAGGDKLPDRQEADIEAELAREGSWAPVTGVGLGSVSDYAEAERLYTQFLRAHAPDLSGLRIALDCANGAAHRVGPAVFQAAGADVFAVYTAPDGHNINRGCGSTHLDHLRRIVREGGHDLGVAFDGDADRALLVDSRGNVVQGDHMLLLLARARGAAGVVTTVMANMALEVKLARAGVRTERTQVGDRYVHERLHATGLTLGGEQSGHVLLLDLSPTGDGLLTALQTLAAARQLGVTLDELHDELEMYPQTLVNVPVPDKRAAARDPEVAAALRQAEARLAGRGRVNLRPSGTESLVRVMVEGQDEAEIHEVAQGLARLIEARAGRPL